MNKICTNIEQSKRLQSLGIDINTADMCWSLFTIITNGNKDIKQVLLPISYGVVTKQPAPNFIERYPAWSLSALLELIKSEIYGENIYGDTVTYKVKFRKYKFTDDIDLYQIAYGSIKFDVDGQQSFKDMVNTGEKENLIDAAFEMVVWLKENKKI